MEMLDYYGVLGVGVGASEKEIKGAYRRLAKRTHPDLAPVGRKKVAEEQFKVVAEAYYVLSDKYRRCEYDLSRKGQAGVLAGAKAARATRGKQPKRKIEIKADDLLEEILRHANEEFYRVDRATYAVRFGCGSFLGIFVGMWFGLYIFPYEQYTFFFFLLLWISVFGCLSAVYGDKFWNFLLRFGDLNWRRWK
ncbi:MAG: DnaJ domain-containing protein [Planctomycetes bacterium]|nr:DnaJ domain-containing protein [Planctomycetota bacterium]